MYYIEGDSFHKNGIRGIHSHIRINYNKDYTLIEYFPVNDSVKGTWNLLNNGTKLSQTNREYFSDSIRTDVYDILYLSRDSLVVGKNILKENQVDSVYWKYIYLHFENVMPTIPGVILK